MLSSPISVTIDGTAYSLPRINNDNFGSVYRLRTATYELNVAIRHSYEGKAGATQFERHNVDLTKTTWDVDGKPIVTQCYTVFRTPRNVDPDRVADQAVGLNTFVSANIAALAAWES